MLDDPKIELSSEVHLNFFAPFISLFSFRYLEYTRIFSMSMVIQWHGNMQEVNWFTLLNTTRKWLHSRWINSSLYLLFSYYYFCRNEVVTSSRISRDTTVIPSLIMINRLHSIYSWEYTGTIHLVIIQGIERSRPQITSNIPLWDLPSDFYLHFKTTEKVWESILNLPLIGIF